MAISTHSDEDQMVESKERCSLHHGDHGPLHARDMASSEPSTLYKRNGRHGFKSGNFFYK